MIQEEERGDTLVDEAPGATLRRNLTMMQGGEPSPIDDRGCVFDYDLGQEGTIRRGNQEENTIRRTTPEERRSNTPSPSLSNRSVDDSRTPESVPPDIASLHR